MTGNDIVRRPKVEGLYRVKLPSATVDQLTDTGHADYDLYGQDPEAAQIVYCTNGAAGSPCLAVYSGGSWLRVALGAAISAT